ncbi:MAG TPA: isoprenylcysteine carboxylmethyltransferase family protein [Candidatus Nitrosotalea sp.]|nr:isoprenylcysteine carboxylmethyltransferase family protein [Candidatus Nitrosotalea sp.]
MQGHKTKITTPRWRSAGYWADLGLGRLLPALVFSPLWVDKLLLTAAAAQLLGRGRGDPLGLATQVLGLAYFTLLIVLYAVRLPRLAGDRRPQLVLASLFGTFGVLLLGVLPDHARPALAAPAALILLAGLAYTVWALSTLRRSFSILPEARRLVTNGPYRFSRHPLYLGEALAAIGLLLPQITPPRVVLIIVVLIAQYVRIKAEETILARQFGAPYADYRRRVPAYLPGPWPR